jgi:hypothetical protein
VKTPVAAIAAEIFGARTRPVDPATSVRFKALDLLKDLNSIKSELYRALPDLQKTEHLNPSQVAAYLKVHPDTKAARILKRYIARAERFKREYPANEIPPSPEKLLKAIQAQGKK